MRKILYCVLVFIMLFAYTACGSKDDSYIGEEKAKEYALTDAGYTVDDATFSTSELKSDDDGNKYYHLTFTVDGVEYDYQIDAASGDIVSSTSGDNNDTNDTTAYDYSTNDSTNDATDNVDNTDNTDTTSDKNDSSTDTASTTKK